jgi:hypothetical protein
LCTLGEPWLRPAVRPFIQTASIGIELPINHSQVVYSTSYSYYTVIEELQGSRFYYLRVLDIEVCYSVTITNVLPELDFPFESEYPISKPD